MKKKPEGWAGRAEARRRPTPWWKWLLRCVVVVFFVFMLHDLLPILIQDRKQTQSGLEQTIHNVEKTQAQAQYDLQQQHALTQVPVATPTLTPKDNHRKETKLTPIKMVLGPGVQVATSITGARHLEAAVEKAISNDGSGPFTGNAFRDLVKKGEIFYSAGTTEVELCIDSKYTRPDLVRVKLIPFFKDADHSKVFYAYSDSLR